MIINTAISLATAAGLAAAVATALAAHLEAARRTVVVKHPPINGPGDGSESWSARQNVTDKR